MGELRQNILRQQLQAELEKAQQLEGQGKEKEAGVHYSKAGAMARKLAYQAPREDAEDFFQTASQYESLGKIIRTTDGHVRASSPDIIDQLIVTQKPSTTWEDIGGLEEAKKTLKQAIILPFVKGKPDFVTITKSILLYGPPGTGKTMLAKASSNTLNATFFEAKASSLLSKYFGESSKIISTLFGKARKMQPSLIFMDEIDSLAPSRDSGIDESSRRVVGQMLSEMEGFEGRRDEKVLFMGATNKPWDIDDALLSRFQRKIFVPLPDAESRKVIFELHLKGADLSKVNIEKLLSDSAGYSGRDIAALCQEAISLMIREKNPDLENLSAKQLEVYTLDTRGMLPEDFAKAFEKVKPSSKVDTLDKYDDWGKEFG
jgi:SpoVK/Ycf46/Vps4 family AAA+-type ATPase